MKRMRQVVGEGERYGEGEGGREGGRATGQEEAVVIVFLPGGASHSQSET